MRAKVAGIVVIGGLLGAGAGAVSQLVARDSTGGAGPRTDDVRTVDSFDFDTEIGDPSKRVVDPAAVPEATAAAAETAAAAVEGFLAAESRQDYAASYGFLSAGDRAEVGPQARWVQSHGTQPVVTGFAIEARDEGVRRATYSVTLSYRPELSEIIGLVPERADATYQAVREDGGWRVALARGRATPRFETAGAKEAALDWARGRQSCADGDADDADDGGLLGPGADVLADRLCQTTSAPAATRAEPFDASDARVTDFVNLYGPEIGLWARQVRLTAPSELTVVLAPVGSEWQVIGLLQ